MSNLSFDALFRKDKEGNYTEPRSRRTAERQNIADDQAFQLVAMLRNAGYAIAIWTPEETEGINVDCFEDRLIELGNDTIEIMQQ